MTIVEVYLIETPSEEGAVTEGDWGSSSVNECYFLQVTDKSKFECETQGICKQIVNNNKFLNNFEKLLKLNELYIIGMF